MGYDMDGLAVYVIEFGHWHYRALAEQPKEKVDEFWVYHEQVVRRQEKDAALNNGQGMVQLIDWGLGWFRLNPSCIPACHEAAKMFEEMPRINDSVKYGFYVKVNFGAETFIRAMTPFVGTAMEKFEICGTIMPKCTQMLLQKIQLAPKYSGSNTEWQPVPFTC